MQHTFIRSTVDRLGAYTFEACVSGWVEYDKGSSGTRAVVEVVVLPTVVEVVVPGRRGSSRSRFGEELDGFESLRRCRGTCGLGDSSCTCT